MHPLPGPASKPGHGAVRLAAALLAGAALFAALGLRAHPGAADPCDRAAAGLASDLYCFLLVPTPDLRAVLATVELQPAPSPFTLSVTADGRLRHQPVVRIEGLPDPASLGAYRTYVAWAVSPTFTTVERLGEVTNGRTTLPVVDLAKYMILVSAEPSADVAERTGRLVLRGFSPSTRRQPADVIEFAIGSGTGSAAGDAEEDGNGAASAGAHGHGHTPGAVAGGWPMPPMPPGIAMLPAMMTLDPPRATPYLPAPADSAGIPPVRPRELIRMADGDTLALEARYVRQTRWGRPFIGYGFNGQVPGPLIQVERDAEIVVVFRNSIDWPATIHWHGIRVENRFDGVPHVTQEPVAPGDSFTYRIRFPDAGIYWYHPHHREDILKELGLYGNLLVDHPAPDYWGPAHREEVLVLDDFLLTDDGAPYPLGREGATHAFMGRFGNVLLVNGEPGYRLDVDRGEVVRFHFTNVSNTRTFNVSFPGARMKLVGGDLGGLAREAWVESVVIAPAERYVVHVRFDEAGRVPMLNRVQAVDHLFGTYVPRTDTLGVIAVGDRRAEPDLGGPFGRLRENPWVARDLAPYLARVEEAGDRAPDRELVLTMATDTLPFVVERLMMFDSAYFDPVEWTGTMPMMNRAATGRQVRWILRDPATGRENMEIDWEFDVGDVVRLRLRNERRVLHGMHHPIHIHGQRFLVLAVNGVPTQNPGWKDTILLPAGATADLLLEVSNPGTWMLHCHISEHLETGMHMTFTAEGGDGVPARPEPTGNP